jgi:hypothetical protein
VCRPCLLVAAGVRRSARPSVSRSDFRRRRREVIDERDQRATTMTASLMADMSHLDDIEYAAEARPRGRVVIEWKV